MRAALALANYTGWSRSEIGEMSQHEFLDWLEQIPKNDGET